jgi:GR25 family glycosyltransferase involved in LPS biosynthesis
VKQVDYTETLDLIADQTPKSHAASQVFVLGQIVAHCNVMASLHENMRQYRRKRRMQRQADRARSLARSLYGIDV